jgi:signal transduction histidine kinase
MGITGKINLIIALTLGLAIAVVYMIGQISGYLLIMICLIFFIMALSIGLIINSKIFRPIENLIRQMRKITFDTVGDKKKFDKIDEIEQLSKAIDELSQKIKEGAHKHIKKEIEIDRAKSDFVALASHQLRTPLSIIKWYVDFMLEEDAGPLNPDQKRYLKEVYKSNEHLIELVNALLDVSRIDVGTFAIKPEPSDLVQIANSALEAIGKDIAEKNIQLIKNFDKGLPNINLDPKLTKVVFQNILYNSVKYTPKGGIIGVNIKKRQNDILIEMFDSGCGIPPGSQPKIFTKLFRAENVKKIESEGTGLGLYIVKAIVDKSGGKIWFESKYKEPKDGEAQAKNEKGDINTTFYISIPLKGMIKKSGSKELTGFKG